MRRVIAVVAFVGFCLSFVVHVSGYLGTNLIEDFSSIWLLHLGAMAVWVPLNIALRRDGWMRGKYRVYRLMGFLEYMPEQTRSVVRMFYFYTIANFLISIFTFNIPRAFSGHWMFFYLLPAIYFWFPAKTKKRDDHRHSEDPDAYFDNRDDQAPKFVDTQHEADRQIDMWGSV